MTKFRALILLLTLFQLIWVNDSTNTADEELAKFLTQVNENLSKLYNKEILANWQNEIKGPNDLVALLQSEIAAEEIIKYIKSIWPKVLKFKRLKVTDENLKRQLLQIPSIGYEVLPKKDLETMYTIMTNMSEIYRHVNLCAFENRNQCNLTLIPDVQNRLHSSKNIDEIEYYWLEWREKTGIAAQENFRKFVELYKKTAKLNGYTKPSDFWFKNLEENSEQTISLLNKFLQELRPLFLQFHAYVRQHLRKSYGVEEVPVNKPYPQNLAEIFIGNAFQDSESRKRTQLPYPSVGMPNITKNLVERGLSNMQRIFLNVAEFYRSLGMEPLSEDFWSENAQPKANMDETYTTCWHKAWKFYGLKERKLSYCSAIDEERFFNMFEAVSDLYYYRAYEEQPALFQEEPFPNFSDALGKVFMLSASSPKFLEKLKLVEPGVFNEQEARINRLYLQGLRTIFLIPVFYVLDRYRVDVIDGRINITNNCAYWKLTEDYTGASTPVSRSNKDFDAPAKLLFEVDDQYASQIMSIVLQFQLFKRFCELSGQYEKGNPARPLDLCDLSNQRKIGPLVTKAMSLGSSKSYKDILNLMTGENELKIDGLLEYFEPLKEWLISENKMLNAELDWEPSWKCSS